MNQLRVDRTSSLNAYVLSKSKKVKRIKRAYDINSVFYSITIRNFTVSAEQSNKMFVLNDIVSNNSRIKIQISQ